MASKPTGDQGQQWAPMGKSSGAATTKWHCGTTGPENATLVEDTTHNNTPVQEPGSSRGHGQNTETASKAQHLATLHIGRDRKDLTTGDLNTGTRQEVQSSDCHYEI